MVGDPQFVSQAVLQQCLGQSAVAEQRDIPAALLFAGGRAVAEAVRGLGKPGDWRMLPVGV